MSIPRKIKPSYFSTWSAPGAVVKLFVAERCVAAVDEASWHKVFKPFCEGSFWSKKLGTKLATQISLCDISLLLDGGKGTELGSLLGCEGLN
eukprot:5699130-Pleurochrysis_carterae.AAC.1